MLIHNTLLLHVIKGAGTPLAVQAISTTSPNFTLRYPSDGIISTDGGSKTKIQILFYCRILQCRITNKQYFKIF